MFKIRIINKDGVQSQMELCIIPRVGDSIPFPLGKAHVIHKVSSVLLAPHKVEREFWGVDAVVTVSI